VIQIDLNKVANVLALRDKSFADYPDLAAQIMVINDMWAKMPWMDAEMLAKLLVSLLTEEST